MEWITSFIQDLQLSAPALWHGLSITLKVVCIATLGGIFIGTLLALMRLSSIRALNLLALDGGLHLRMLNHHRLNEGNGDRQILRGKGRGISTGMKRG